jgi:hypothetical protein
MEVISIHVPKTAGSTFGNILTSIYGAGRVFLDYDDFVLNPLSPYNADREGWRTLASAQIRALGPDIRAIHGHFAVEKYRESFPEARRVAWVRHPASWVISLYYHWKNWPRYHLPFANPLIRRLDAEGLSLVEFAEDPIVRNRVSGLFLRGLPLGEFSFLGVQEHFDDDLQELAQMMGWPEVRAGLDNRSPQPGYGDRLRELREDRGLIEHLVALNEEDMALYEEALRLRALRLRERRARAERQARRVAIRERLAGGRGDRSPQTA